MRINCQCRVAAATAPSSGVASLTMRVSSMTPVSATALVAIPLLSPLVTGHGILVTGMSITLPLLFDHHHSPLPRFGSEVEPFLRLYCLVLLLSWLSGYLPTRSYCWTTVIVLRYLLSRSYLLSCVPLRTGLLSLLFTSTILPSTYGSISSTCISIGTL